MKNLRIKLLSVAIYLFLITLKLNAQGDKSFLNPPQLVGNPSSISKYSVNSRKFSGIPSLAVTLKGRLWSVWYAGITPDEDQNNYVVVSTSEDMGKTWKEVLVIDPDGPGSVRAYDPQTWIDPDGKLWIFWAQVIDGEESKHYNSVNAGVWAMLTNNADTINPTWSDPKRITEGVMMCKPIVLSTGEWFLPASTWRIKGSAKALVSTDHGQNWQVRGTVNVPEAVWDCDEHMIIERKDGSLWMLVRTKYGIGESISNDKGFTWSTLIPSKIQHPVARFFIRRLNSGNLLLVKHGPIDMRIGRSHLMAFVSKDDGHSWSNGLLLDERNLVSYPDGQQTQDGTIYITYDYNRLKDQNILITSFTEDDIMSGTDVRLLLIYKNRRVISSGALINTLKTHSANSIPASPQIIKNPSSVEEYSPESRKFTGIPSMAANNNGSLWAIRYSGITPAEDKNNYLAKGNMQDRLNQKLLPPGWDPVQAGDIIMQRLIRVTAPHVKGAHDAEFVCVGKRAYIVEHDNDVAPGHGAGAAMYCVLTVVNLKTLCVEKTYLLAKAGQEFVNVTLPNAQVFVPRIIRKDKHTLRTYFCNQPAKEQAVTWYRDFDLRTRTFEGSIHKAKLKTAAGIFDMEPSYFHADAAALGFKKPPVNRGLYIFDSFKEFAGHRYVALNNFEGKQNALAVLHDDFKTFEIIGHYNEPQSQQLSESAVNRLPDGTWMAICRNDAGNYHFTTSKDGKTWAIAQPLPSVPNGLNSKPTFDRFGGIYYLGWQENTRIQDCNRSVFNVDISRDGKTWERKYRFETPYSFQYPTFHEHDGTIWLSVTQSDHKGSSDRIMFGKLEKVGKFASQADKEQTPKTNHQK